MTLALSVVVTDIATLTDALWVCEGHSSSTITLIPAGWSSASLSVADSSGLGPGPRHTHRIDAGVAPTPSELAQCCHVPLSLYCNTGCHSSMLWLGEKTGDELEITMTKHRSSH